MSGAVGGLALEPATRRRMRLNGRGSTAADGITIALEQVYSNCPKYIATRHPTAVKRDPPARTAGERLDAVAERLLAAAVVRLDRAAPLRWWLERPGRYPSSA